MIKMILTDLDHTLLRSDGTVSQHTLEVLKQCRNRGVLLSIATARYWIGAEKYIDLLSPDYEITTDGTLIHSKDGCIYSCSLSPEQTDLIVSEVMKAVPGGEITVANGKTVYWNSPDIAKSEKLHKAVFCSYEQPLDCTSNKIVALLPDEQIAVDISAKAGCSYLRYRGENWYAFLPKDSGKIAAIRALSEKCGIALQDFAAFGDDLNDIGMLRICGTGVAVSNAVKEAADAAGFMTSSNDEEGVARWLEENILR